MSNAVKVWVTGIATLGLTVFGCILWLMVGYPDVPVTEPPPLPAILMFTFFGLFVLWVFVGGLITLWKE